MADNEVEALHRYVQLLTEASAAREVEFAAILKHQQVFLEQVNLLTTACNQVQLAVVNLIEQLTFAGVIRQPDFRGTHQHLA